MLDHNPTTTPEFLESRLKQIIEALLFTSNQPLTLQRLHEVIGKPNLYTVPLIQESIHQLRCEYAQNQRPITIDTVQEGYILRTRPEYAEYIYNLYSEKPTVERLSTAALEVLSIIAYRGPATRSEIESLRGVDSSGSVMSLLERELIYAVGRRESIGRPTLYAVTQRFFTYFGIESLQSLPMYTELAPPPSASQPVLPMVEAKAPTETLQEKNKE